MIYRDFSPNFQVFLWSFSRWSPLTWDKILVNVKCFEKSTFSACQGCCIGTHPRYTPKNLWPDPNMGWHLTKTFSRLCLICSSFLQEIVKFQDFPGILSIIRAFQIKWKFYSFSCWWTYETAGESMTSYNLPLKIVNPPFTFVMITCATTTSDWLEWQT